MVLLNEPKHHHTEKLNISDKERFPKLKTRDVRHDKRSPPGYHNELSRFAHVSYEHMHL